MNVILLWAPFSWRAGGTQMGMVLEPFWSENGC